MFLRQKKYPCFANLFFIGAFALTSSFAFAGPFDGVSLPSFAGEKSFSMAEVAKQDLTVIQFWAQWCGACKKNIKDIYAAQTKIPFKFIAVNVDDSKKDADDFFANQAKKPTVTPFKKDAYYDADKKLLQQLKATSLPTIVVVDKSGKILGKLKGRLKKKKLVSLAEMLSKGLAK